MSAPTILTLEVVGEQARHLGADSRKVFNGIGGTIGRLPDNDWVFPDPYVSGRHALIRYLNGKYFVEDASTNGVFINSRDKRLERHQAHPLQDGDRIYIDAFQIMVSITRNPARAAQRDPFAGLAARTSAKAGRPEASPTAPGRDRTAKLADRASQDQAEDHETEWFGMTDVTQKLPDPAADPSQRSLHAHAALRRASPAAADRDGAAQLRQALEGAGVDGADRKEALIAAMRAAFEATLAHFDPERLQQEFERQGAPAKSRYWELYRDRYAQLLKDGERAFCELFGEAFGNTCKQELERLGKMEERKGRR